MSGDDSGKMLRFDSVMLKIVDCQKHDEFELYRDECDKS